ncbi:odorant receptor 42a [Pseudomyrmex gracilis]|uniref:odorant receptor 42a n=1 Tax=Pseudomyrmex gracilis TaxID=219809 RepID=UPI0009957509|nr:odorant receptor 42a [Pseudomyrmex gracilis]
MIFPQILDVFVPLNESRKNEHPFHAEFFIDNEKYFYLIRLQMYLIILLVLGAVLAHATMFVVYAQHASGMFIVLGFVDIIQSCYELNIFVEFLSLIALIGITMVQTVKFSGLSDERSLRSIAFVGGQSIYLFICSYAGQQIIDTSTQLFMKTYSGKWHNMSLWKQKMMLFVMMRCMQTISIRPYNHYVVSLESFSTILQSAISVCMLLRRL